jgi:hypothetical protein
VDYQPGTLGRAREMIAAAGLPGWQVEIITAALRAAA